MKIELDNILAENNVDSLFLYSDSSRDANMYYLTQFFAPDAFIFLKKINQEPIIVVSQMECSRAQKQSTVKNVKSYFDYNYQKIVKSAKNPQLGRVDFIVKVAEKELGKGSKICVPPNFPLLVADFLRKEGLSVTPMLGVVEKARETKGIQEVEVIKKIQQINEKVTSEAIDLIANTEVGANKILLQDGEPLTVGNVKAFFGYKLLENGCLPEEDLIVACGPKSSDPHYAGEADDKLKADQPIILDIYPRSIQKRYWADMTRTVVKGKASLEVKKMFDAVFEAKNASLDAVHAGAIGSQVYDVCCDVLEKNGYQTERNGQKVTKGMTHGLGHGVGLQIHESPRINEFSSFPLKEHVVVTIEPGVYNPKVGGLRLEDIIEVTKSGYNNLTKMGTQLEI
ncbi:MAG: Xaa-Pro peptidase family protein [Candidatus Bathyarchaeota archaeon]|nr:Xaa-Pro peptidase family protein [Candidatus Bathyarchaeum tardum]WGM89452.1 MAG: Xaa-Pro peptidase family protein [Candidatus Bathyarchaeum tardum]